MKKNFFSIFSFFFLILSVLFSPLKGAQINLSVESASRFSQPLYDFPGKAEVLVLEELNSCSQMSLDKKLALLSPGLDSSRNFSDFSDRNAVLTMRGFGIGSQGGRGQGRTLILLDGIPLNTSANGGVILNDLGKEDIEKVEIIKGPASALYGSNALAGVINAVTKKPQPKRELSLSLGSYGLIASSAKAGFKFGKFSFDFSAGQLESEGYFKALPLDRDIYSRRSWVREKNASFRSYLDSAYGEFSASLSYFDGLNGLGTNYRGDARGEYRRNINDVGKISWHLKKEGLEFKAAAYWLEGVQDRNEGSSPTRLTEISVNKGDKGLMTAAFASLWGADCSFGFDWKAGYVNGYDDYLNGKYAKDKGKIKSYSPFFQAEKKFFSDRLTLVAGARYDYFKFYDGYAYNGYAPGFFSSALHDKSRDKVSFKGSAGFDYALGFSQYVSYSQGFRNAELENMVLTLVKGSGSNKWYQKPNPSLGPEKTQTLESGFRFNPFNGLYLDPSFYLTSAEDFIYQILTGTTDPVYGKEKMYANIARVKIYGAEFPLKYFKGNFVFSASYAQSYSEIVDSPGLSLKGKNLTYAPRSIYSVNLSRKGKKSSFFLDWSYKSRQFIDDSNASSIAGYGCVGAGASITIFKDATASLSVSNIFDKRFQQAESELAPGRTFIFSIKKIF